MKFPVLFLFIFFLGYLHSQKKYELEIAGNDFRNVKKKIHTHFKDSISRDSYLKELRYSGIKKGYLLCSIDSLFFDGDKLNAKFYTGPRFQKANINISKKNLSDLKKVKSVNEKLIANTSFSSSEIAGLLRRIQTDFENNGYPFVNVYLDSIEIDEARLQAILQIQKGPAVKWTKINLRGEQPVNPRLLSSYIHIKPGQLFNQSDVQLISGRLQLIPFIEEIKPAELLFTQEGVELFLYLKAKPVSLANGVIGLQPNAATGKMMLTGDLRLKLVNVIKRAETLDLNWKSIQYQTQSLKALVNVPNLFRTPFGIDFQFQMYKRDSSFLELKPTFGVQYSLNNGSYLKVFYRNNTSSVLRGGMNNPSFAKLGTTKTNYYGIAWMQQTLDYLPNPTKGFSIYAELSAGQRKSRLYDTMPLVTNTTFSGEINFNYFIPLTKRHVLRLGNQTNIYNAPLYFQNEAIRFGGQITQRGFNEEEIYSTTRTTFTAEYRFLVDRNSFAFLFYDQSWYENNITSYYKDHPFGVGIGFTFGTKIGAFSISYALGKQFNNPIQLKDGKVHFGYIAYF